jgi:hypothetical protein
MSQRAYVVQNKNPDKPAAFEARIAASQESPVVNLCLVIKGWGDANASVVIDGKVQKEGQEVRPGSIRKIDGNDLVVWVKKKYVTHTNIEIKPELHN